MPDASDPLYRRLDKAEDSPDVPSSPQQVPVNMYESDKALVVLAPLPGVMPEDVEIRVEGGKLHIQAAMRTAAPKDYLLHEWHYGPYERIVDLPAGFGSAGKASFDNGQLAVHLERGDADGAAVVITP